MKDISKLSYEELFGMPRPKKLDKRLDGLSSSHREKLSVAMVGNANATVRPVLDTNTGIVYKSAREAARKLGLPYHTVSNSVRRGGRPLGYLRYC